MAGTRLDEKTFNLTWDIMTKTDMQERVQELEKKVQINVTEIFTQLAEIANLPLAPPSSESKQDAKALSTPKSASVSTSLSDSVSSLSAETPAQQQFKMFVANINLMQEEKDDNDKFLKLTLLFDSAAKILENFNAEVNKGLGGLADDAALDKFLSSQYQKFIINYLNDFSIERLIEYLKLMNFTQWELPPSSLSPAEIKKFIEAVNNDVMSLSTSIFALNHGTPPIIKKHYLRFIAPLYPIGRFKLFANGAGIIDSPEKALLAKNIMKKIGSNLPIDTQKELFKTALLSIYIPLTGNKVLENIRALCLSYHGNIPNLLKDFRTKLDHPLIKGIIKELTTVHLRFNPADVLKKKQEELINQLNAQAKQVIANHLDPIQTEALKKLEEKNLSSAPYLKERQRLASLIDDAKKALENPDLFIKSKLQQRLSSTQQELTAVEKRIQELKLPDDNDLRKKLEKIAKKHSALIGKVKFYTRIWLVDSQKEILPKLKDFQQEEKIDEQIDNKIRAALAKAKQQIIELLKQKGEELLVPMQQKIANAVHQDYTKALKQFKQKEFPFEISVIEQEKINQACQQLIDKVKQEQSQIIKDTSPVFEQIKKDELFLQTACEFAEEFPSLEAEMLAIEKDTQKLKEQLTTVEAQLAQSAPQTEETKATPAPLLLSPSTQSQPSPLMRPTTTPAFSTYAPPPVLTHPVQPPTKRKLAFDDVPPPPLSLEAQLKTSATTSIPAPPPVPAAPAPAVESASVPAPAPAPAVVPVSTAATQPPLEKKEEKLEETRFTSLPLKEKLDSQHPTEALIKHAIDAETLKGEVEALKNDFILQINQLLPQQATHKKFSLDEKIYLFISEFFPEKIFTDGNFIPELNKLFAEIHTKTGGKVNYTLQAMLSTEAKDEKIDVNNLTAMQKEILRRNIFLSLFTCIQDRNVAKQVFTYGITTACPASIAINIRSTNSKEELEKVIDYITALKKAQQTLEDYFNFLKKAMIKSTIDPIIAHIKNILSHLQDRGTLGFGKKYSTVETVKEYLLRSIATYSSKSVFNLTLIHQILNVEVKKFIEESKAVENVDNFKNEMQKELPKFIEQKLIEKISLNKEIILLDRGKNSKNIVYRAGEFKAENMQLLKMARILIGDLNKLANVLSVPDEKNPAINSLVEQAGYFTKKLTAINENLTLAEQKDMVGILKEYEEKSPLGIKLEIKEDKENTSVQLTYRSRMYAVFNENLNLGMAALDELGRRAMQNDAKLVELQGAAIKRQQTTLKKALHQLLALDLKDSDKYEILCAKEVGKITSDERKLLAILEEKFKPIKGKLIELRKLFLAHVHELGISTAQNPNSLLPPPAVAKVTVAPAQPTAKPVIPTN